MSDNDILLNFKTGTSKSTEQKTLRTLPGTQKVVILPTHKEDMLNLKQKGGFDGSFHSGLGLKGQSLAVLALPERASLTSEFRRE